tara:strand:+ start:230 stop:2323 length:2094 start_codon:yes stop_codon:yes gene_type:complete
MEDTTPVKPTGVSALRNIDPTRLFERLFALTLALMLIPIWMTDWPPLQDLGGHIELMDAMHRYDDDALAYRTTYHLPGWFDANSLSLGIAWLLGPLIGTLATSKLLLSFYVIGLPLSLVAVARAFERSPWLVMAGCPLVFNALLNVGFINYLIAMPLMFWMIPLAIRLAREETVGAAISMGVCALLLFYAHVIGFLIGWSMAAFILTLYGQRRSWKLGLIATLPSLLILGFWVDRMFLDPVATELGRTFGTEERGLATTHKPFIDKFTTFHAWGTNFFRDSLDEVALVFIATVWATALFLNPKMNPKKLREGSKSLHDQPRLYGLEIITTVCFIAYLLLPSGANEIAILAERVPIMVIVFLLLWPRTTYATRGMKWLFLLASLVSMAYPFAVQARFTEFEREEIGELHDVVAHMKPGSSVAYVLQRPNSERTFMKPLWHIPKAMHAIQNGGISHDSFAIRPYTPIQYQTGQTPTRVRPRFERTASIYEYDYLLIQSSKPPTSLFKRDGVEFVTNTSKWWLFEVKDPDEGLNILRSPGRGGFRDLYNCPPGTVLRGLSGEKLSVIGNIKPLCSTPTRSSIASTDIGKPRQRKRRLTKGPVYGRPMKEGQTWEALCDKGEAIAGLQGRHEDFLRSLEVICRPVHSLKKKNERDYVLKAVATDQPTNFRALCPEGSVATGYRGRSGLFIDQVGMRCEVSR